MRRGFTLLELVIVIIVLGILASFAIPQFIRAAEKARAGEALSLAPTIAAAQVRYAAEWGSTTAVQTALDIDVPAPKYFTLALTGAVTGANIQNSAVMTLTRRSDVNNAGGYNYVIRACGNGKFYCYGASATTGCPVVGLTSSAACP